MDEFLEQMLTRRAAVFERRQGLFDDRDGILAEARSADVTQLDDARQARFDSLSRSIEGTDEELASLDSHINEVREDIVRSGIHDNPLVMALRRGGGATQEDTTRAWASDVVRRVRQMSPESRAVISGSIDIPSLVLPSVVAQPHPARLVDALIGRTAVQSTAVEWFRQTVRTTAAAPVADLAPKPMSVYTVAAVPDRCRVLAHLSDYVPLRIWEDETAIRSWLQLEMSEGLLDALEDQCVNGDAAAENFDGILHAAGTTRVAFDTDMPTTLRRTLAAAQTAGESPTGWVMHPDDAAAIDLTRADNQPGNGLFLLDGYQQGTSGSGNVFGAVQPRIICPSVPAGTALLANWSDVYHLFVRQGMRLDVDAASGFATNSIRLRCEMRCLGVVTRPAGVFIADLTATATRSAKKS